MNILLIGSGGREHTFAWKLAQSPQLKSLFIAPGNAGTKNFGENVSLNINDFSSLSKFINENGINLVIVGPEAPLVGGLADKLNQAFPELMIIGPKQSGAMLEGSKSFAKRFMQKYGIPTADYAEFSKENLDEGIHFLNSQSLPIVLKADGLAAGKGVLICHDRKEAIREFNDMLNGKFGSAGEKVVIESFLSGIEFSVFVITDGIDYKILPVAKDYKRIGEGDTGLNTGGMGSISPVPFVDKTLMEKVEKTIIIPTIEGIKKEGLEYIGFIFFGLILVEGNPMVIEYNCRMGDPETQSVFPRLKNDLVELCKATGQNRLSKLNIDIDPKTVASVVLVSGGYPGKYEKGKVISGLNKVMGSLIFHAGTIEEDQQVKTNGGRVLAITSFGNDIPSALQTSTHNIEKLHFDGMYYRRDIGFDL